jgi:hypothetical protein
MAPVASARLGLARRAGIGHLRALRDVACALLFMTTMLSAIATLPGCIVPVDIRNQPQGADSPPVILDSGATPPFDEVVNMQVNGMPFDLTFYVDDTDLDDTIYSRLFRSVSGTNVLIQDHSPLPFATDATDKARRQATFGPNAYCSLLGISAGNQVILTALVTDRPFLDDTSDELNPGQLSDSRNWTLQCD